MAIADAEDVHAPEGNTRPSGVARRGRSAGVLRPWHAGRETSKHVGGPTRSCPWKTTVYGLQLLRHGRGNPDTEPCENLRVAVTHGAGRWRSPVTGKARRRGRGAIRVHGPPRWAPASSIGHLLQHVMIIIVGMIAVIGHRDQASPLAIYLAQDGVEQGVSLRRQGPLTGSAPRAAHPRQRLPQAPV